jgi:hypothetical protein
MKKLIGTALLVGLLSGCIVRTNSRRQASSGRSRACPPAYHWNGWECVHNGRARGHHK